MRGIKLLVILLMGSFLVSGCIGGSSPPPENKKPAPTPAKNINKNIKKAVSEAKTAEQTKGKEVLEKVGITYTYDPVNKPDPFKPYSADDGLELTNTENALLKYEVRYFRLVGVSSDGSEPIALFEDPNQKAYILRVGDQIGRAGGVVQSIAKDTVIVTETRIKQDEGAFGTETVQIPIRLHPQEK